MYLQIKQVHFINHGGTPYSKHSLSPNSCNKSLSAYVMLFYFVSLIARYKMTFLSTKLWYCFIIYKNFLSDANYKNLPEHSTVPQRQQELRNSFSDSVTEQ